MLAIAQIRQPVINLDEAGRKAIVDATAGLLREGYVDIEKGQMTADVIQAALADGSFDAIDEPQAFAERLTEDMHAVAHDEHLRFIGPREPRPDPSKGVTRADILDGNVGYLQVDAFRQSEQFGQAVNQIMEAFAETRALIIDVRENTGGQGTAGLVTYFVDSSMPVHIHTVMRRIEGTDTFDSTEIWTTPAPLVYDKPVYILTSSRTFSAGEAFAYQMQAMNSATIVGETTRGGGHNGGTRQLAPGFMLFLPIGRGVNPITGTNWEGIGVIPDISSSSADALKVALNELGVSGDSIDIEALSVSRVF